MINIYIIFFVAIILVFSPWLWRYKMRPYYAKSAYLKLLQNHSQQETIKKTLHFLESIYKKINAEAISRRDRRRQSLMDDAYVYGEIDFLSFILILEKTKPQSGEIFYDLGSGAGKAVFAAALSYDFSKVYGIERLPGLYKLAQIQINKAVTLAHLTPSWIKNYLLKIKTIHFINGDFLQQDIADGDIIFINATCLNYYTWEKVVHKLTALKQGSRVIVTTKKISNEQFSLLYHDFELMSWGMNSVNIYLKVT